MIPNPALYNQDEAQISHDLLPIKRRKSKFLAWLLALLEPVQYDHDLVFDSYANGVNYANWVSGTTYTYLERVIYIDNAVYELQTVAGLVSMVAPNIDTTNWIKVLDDFVGVRERARYNSQKLLFEYALNRRFQVTPFSTIEWNVTWSVGVPTAQSAPPYSQIYISNTNNVTSNFWLSNGGLGALTSYMANNSIFQNYYLGNAYPIYSPYTFTIYVPSAIYVAIGANQVLGVTAEDAIRAFADKYVQAGKQYNIVQY